jgi:cobalamin biosynthesis Mg chelatase CobN
MINQVIAAMDTLVDEIYTPDQNKIREMYLQLINSIGDFLQWMAEQGYQVDLNEDLGKLQNAMSKKDYIAASDILMFDMKPDFEQLGKDMSS